MSLRLSKGTLPRTNPALFIPAVQARVKFEPPVFTCATLVPTLAIANLEDGRPMWLISHATGTLGQAVSRAADARGHELRLLVPQGLKAPPDMADKETVGVVVPNPSALAPMFEGVDRAVLSAPMGPALPEWHGSLAKAARAAGVRQVVQVTASGADVRSPMRIFRWLGEAEERVRAAGINAIVLRPTLYMQTLLKHSPRLCSCSTIEAPFRAARWPMVDVRDVAEIAVKLLESDAPAGVHELTGPQAYDYFEIAKLVSKVIGRRVEYVDVCSPKTRGVLEARQLNPRLIEGLIEFWDYAASGAIEPEVTQEVEELLGHPPRKLADFVREEFKAPAA
jgi:uncharacterized protein YbjT (DUF2867 family)